MIGGVILAIIGAAAVILGFFAKSFGTDEKTAGKIQKVAWILGIILLLGGAAWIGVQVYKEGVRAETQRLAAEAEVREAEAMNNPALFSASAEAYDSCIKTCHTAAENCTGFIFPCFASDIQKDKDQCPTQCKPFLP